jgi:hypothetical protein
LISAFSPTIDNGSLYVFSCIFCWYEGWSFREVWTPWFGSELDNLWGPLQFVSIFCQIWISEILKADFWCVSIYILSRYRIEQELSTEIKQIPPFIDQAIYCQWLVVITLVVLHPQLWLIAMVSIGNIFL